MNLTALKNSNYILLSALSGSRAYGLHHANSDVDIRGVFISPKADFYAIEHTEQINDDTNDTTYYELRRFVELLVKNNPNVLELLLSPADCIQQKHPFFDLILPELFISKLCKNTFANYAISQIKKARGLNKKIVNPVGKERKSILDFCYVQYQSGSIPLRKWLTIKQIDQKKCGLAKIAHIKGLYAIYHSDVHIYAGIMQRDNSNDVGLSSIPKGETLVGLLYFNKDGYSLYCKEYRQYWEWVEKRNEHRYQNTVSHGKNYDTKNMMHTFRLLNMAEEIAREGRLHVRRTTDKDFLLEVKSGAYQYDDLVAMANAKVAGIERLFEQSNLPEKPDKAAINALLVTIREQYYEL